VLTTFGGAAAGAVSEVVAEAVEAVDEAVEAVGEVEAVGLAGGLV
jgi:hypothetical protein